MSQMNQAPGAASELIHRMNEPLLPAAVIGGKGHNLARLSQAGIQVPRWIVLTVKGCDRILEGLRPEIERLTAELQAGSRAAAEVSREIRQKIEAAPLDGQLENELKLALNELLRACPQSLFAVRSSAIEEDSADHSFAGQLDSFLFQRPNEELLQSVKRVLASAFSERAFVYRQQNGLSVAEIRAAVVIQEMVFGEVSGVAFTANPINGEPEQTVVSATYGVGEGVVSGELDCDEWTTTPKGEVLSEEVCEKTAMIVFDEVRGTGTTKVPTDLARRGQRCLSPEQLKRLVSLCHRIEREIYAGVPQDIEWCLRGEEFHVLQARPITAFSGLRKQGHAIVFDNSNVVESYAGVPTPLTYSFAAASFRATFRGVYERLGMSKRKLQKMDSLFVNMLGYVHGRMYYNLLNWYRYLEEAPHSGDNVKEFDQLIGIAPANAVEFDRDADRVGETAWDRLMRAKVGLLMRLKVRGIAWVAKDFERHFFKWNGPYVNEFFLHQSNPELIEIYRHVFAYGSPYWDGEIINFIGAQRAYADLGRRLKALGFEDVASIVNDLSGGDGNIASMRPTKEMIAIADLVRSSDAWRELFLSGTPEEIEKQVRDPNAQTFAPVRERIEKLLEDYGCRCMNELKLEEPTYREDASFIFSTIKSYVQKRPMGLEAQLENQIAARRKAEALVYGRAGLFGRLALQIAINRVRRHVYYREELRLIRGKYWGIVRRLFRAVGRNFEKQGLLDEWSDVFLLKVEEIAELVEGRSPDLGFLKELIALRKKSRAENLKRPSPSRVFSYGDVCALNLAYRRSSVKVAANVDGVMSGIACGPGVVEGTAKVVLSGSQAMGLDGEVLVTDRTDPGWIPLYPSISGLVIERGSVLSHSAVVAREMGIPTVVGVAGATELIRSGDTVMVDGGQGTVKVIRQNQATG